MSAKKHAEYNQVNLAVHSPQEIQVAHHSRKLAFEYINKSSFGRALAHLFVTLRLIPEWRQELQSVFWQALSGGCKQLEDEGRLEETIQLRDNALLLYPEDEMICMDIGSIHFKLDSIEKSLHYYQQALRIRPGFLPASRAIQSIYNKQVERWHFRMLNDFFRNDAYHCAIAHRIQQGYSSVLDVGAGTGILSLFAAQEGADQIWACESNTFMIKTAKSVLAANNASERVNLISKHSNLISIPRDIPKKVSMIVTEVFDAGLLGEGILSTLLHAWENLLLPPPNVSTKQESLKSENGIVVPFSATVWVAAIQCIHIARRHRLLPVVCSCRETEKSVSFESKKATCIDIEGVKFCKFCEGLREEFQLDKEEIIFNLNDTSVAFDLSEPYTTEDLENVPFGFEFLSKPHQILEINFNNMEELQAHVLNGLKEEMVLIDSAGSMDAVASWFHLNLDNNGTIVSTAPFNESGIHRTVCWHQAIFPLPASRVVTSGDVVVLNIDTKEKVLKIFEKESAGPGSLNQLLLVSENVVAFLNNRTWIKALHEAAVDFIKHVSGTHSSTKKILDLNPFPVFGLRTLRGCDPFWKLLAKAETSNDKEYIIAVARINSIDANQIQFVTDENLEKKVENEQFDVICINAVEPSGEFGENVTQMLPFLLNKVTSNGTIVPYSLSVECQLIESDKLIQESRVASDENVGNFHITEFMNNFAVDYHLDVPYHGYKFKPLSDCLEIFKFTTNSLEFGSILSEHEQEFLVQSTGNGSVTGIMYWVKLFLRPGMQPISTICPDSHCNQVVLFSSLDVRERTIVKLKCLSWHGMLNIKLSEAES